MHLEMPQVPEDKIDEFCSLKTFKYLSLFQLRSFQLSKVIFRMFNTNNIWVNLSAVKAKLGQMTMEILANKKVIKYHI